jgi:hypothetical protein
VLECDGDDDRETDVIRVRVDLRHLSLFFSADHISPKRVLANLKNDRLLQLFLIHDSVTLQFYVPSIME